MFRLNGGEGGIRTRVPGVPDHLISSQRRYDRFGTSPYLNSSYSFLRHASVQGMKRTNAVSLELSRIMRSHFKSWEQGQP